MLQARAILATRYRGRRAQEWKTLVHLDRGTGRALCYAQRQLMVDDGYNPGPVTCDVCIRRAIVQGLAFSRTTDGRAS